MEYEFQTCSIEAICEHFKKHNRALCADEAGLGKTFIAKGVIEKLAIKKIDNNKVQYETDIKNWWEKFKGTKEIIKKDKGEPLAKWEAIKRFYYTLTKLEIKEDTTPKKFLQGNKGEVKAINEAIDEAKDAEVKDINEAKDAEVKYINEAIDKAKNAEAIYRILKAIAELYAFNQTTTRNMGDWKWNTPLSIENKYDLSSLSFKVIYICNSLAVADQNAKKLVPTKQVSVRNSQDKPDRLSTLWYYCENHPTPGIEIYSITSTVSTVDTPGTANEREKLVELYKKLVIRKTNDKKLDEYIKKYGYEITKERINKPNKNICNDKYDESLHRWLREKGEEESIKKIKEFDLVIFDEFQKFTDIVNLINMKDEDFEIYLENITENVKNAENVKKAENDENTKNTENDDRIDALKRCRKICKGLKDSNTKMLFLSATPFHDPENSEDDKLKRISLPELVEFMSDESTKVKYNEKVKNGSFNDIERILYEECGIFRNERARLLKKNNHAYHLLECSGEGLLSRALSLSPKEQGNENGEPVYNKDNKAERLIRTCPDMGKAYEQYSDSENLDIKKSPNLPSHSRYERLKDVIYAKDGDDVNNKATVEERTDRFKYLLWIPPVNPSKPLGGVFAEYKAFSKTLIYSEMKGTPVSVISTLNAELDNNLDNNRNELVNLKSSKGIKDYLEKILASLNIEDTKLIERLINYLVNNISIEYLNEIIARNSSIDKNNYEDAIKKYCEEGRLADVLREYLEIVEPEDLRLVFDFYNGNDNKKNDDKKKIAYVMDEEDLNQSGSASNVRRNFNSPFYPFVLMTTSIGAEGLDFHYYCNRIAHYVKPRNVIELEQKNGRIDRFHSLAQRRWWSKPNNQFRYEYMLSDIGKETGGMAPDWDAGEGNLHYYYFYTKFTSEKKELEELFEKQRKYKASLGINCKDSRNSINLSPLYQRRMLGKT